MSSPKKLFSKEKTLLPDGRYLLYYNFTSEIKQEPKPETESKRTEGEGHV